MRNTGRLHEAAENGNAEEVRQLIDQGEDVNGTKQELRPVGTLSRSHPGEMPGWTMFEPTPLHYAALGGHESVATVLLRAGADVHAKDSGKTPFDVALRNCSNPEALAAIVEACIASSMPDMNAATFLAIDKRPGGQELKATLQQFVLDPQSDVQNDQRLCRFVETTKQFINAQITSAGEQQSVLAEVYTNSRTVHKKMYDQVMSGIKQENGFQAFVQVASTVQTSLSNGDTPPTVRQRSANVLELYAKAPEINVEFDDFVSTLAEKSGGEFLEAPLKSLFRSLEKIGLRAEGQWDASGLCDIVRGAVQFDKMEDMRTFFNLLCSATVAEGEVNMQGSEGMNAGESGVSTKIVIVRVKNRFDKPTSGGWSDCLVNFYLAHDPDRHVCEVQLVHERLMRVRKQMGAHKQYAQFRSAMELLEATGKADVIARLDREDDERRAAAAASEPTPSEQAVGDVNARLERLERAVGDILSKLDKK